MPSAATKNPKKFRTLLSRRESGSGWATSSQEPRVKKLAKILDWIESYAKIRQKDGKIRTIRLNWSQELLANVVAWHWEQGTTPRIVLPKGRKMGSSTFWEVLFYAMAELIAGFQAAIVAHTDAGAGELFAKIDTVARGLTKSDWGPSKFVSDQGGHKKWDSESALWSATIRTGDALGRGSDPTAIHFSEVGNFQDANATAAAAIVAICNAMAISEWTIEVYESTAKGQDPIFYDMAQKAMDPDAQSTKSLVFLPWFKDSNYVMFWPDYRRALLAAGKKDPGEKFEPTADEVALRERLANTEVEPHQVLYRYRTDLRDEQLIWYRWVLHNRCDGNPVLRAREYPSTVEEAFQSTSASAFTREAIDYYRVRSKPPIVRGRVDALGRFVREPFGPIQLWAQPMPHVRYVIGADVGGTTERADPSSATILNWGTLQQVGAIHGRFEWNVFADLLILAGKFFNNALLVVENNYNPAVADKVHRSGYPNVYYYFPEDVIDPVHGRTPGLNTNRRTRPIMESKLRLGINSTLLDLQDPGLWPEMETFVWVPSKVSKNPDMEGAYRAVGSNKDDRLMSLACALFPIQLEAPEIQPAEVEHKTAVMRFYEDVVKKTTKRAQTRSF